MDKSENTDLVTTDDAPPEVQQMLPMAKLPEGHAPGSTIGLSELKLSNSEKEALMRPVEPDDVEIRPDGIVYMPWIACAKRLDEALGPGRWGVRQERDPFYDPKTQECCYDGSLWIDGKFVSRTIGGCNWRPENRRMSKTDAIEGAKSDCLRRCCKDLGIARQLWTPAWRREWLAEWALPYQTKDYKGKTVIHWRKKGAALGGEALATAQGICGEFPLGFGPDSPVPDGEYAGEPIRDVPDDVLLQIADKASTVEWKLAAKAEIVRRAKAAAKVEQKELSEVTGYSDVIPGENNEPTA